MSTTPNDFTAALLQSLTDGSFVKLTLSGYRGGDLDLQKILARKILVKKVEKLSFTFRYKTRDIVKNAEFTEAAQQVLAHLQNGFTVATLCTTGFDLQWNGKTSPATLVRSAPTQQASASLEHNRSKQRAIGAEKPYLHALGITDAQGRVHPTAQDKYRQINKYIETLSGVLGGLAQKHPLRVADMGAGKGYLTFALYDYLANTLKVQAEVTGVEYRADLVALCNDIAKASAFSGLNFVQAAIDDYDSTGTHLLIALHACDTATDDAIAKGIRAGAEAIVVAPCCHKQIRKQLDAAVHSPSLTFLLKHGSLMERQAEMVTDGLRGMLLELHGYRTKLFEFISDAHTPKNIMIIATRGDLPSPKRQAELQTAIDQAKAQFGVQQHYLETLL